MKRKFFFNNVFKILITIFPFFILRFKTDDYRIDTCRLYESCICKGFIHSISLAAQRSCSNGSNFIVFCCSCGGRRGNSYSMKSSILQRLRKLSWRKYGREKGLHKCVREELYRPFLSPSRNLCCMNETAFHSGTASLIIRWSKADVGTAFSSSQRGNYYC